MKIVRQRAVRPMAAIGFCFLLSGPGTTAAQDVVVSAPSISKAPFFRPTSYRQLRYEGVIGQSDWYTCGPAAAATLLHHYYGIDVDEKAVLESALAESAALGQDPTVGISALALTRALASWGFQTPGYRLAPDDLVQYFQRGGLPLILHVTVPEPHYIVAIGIAGGHLVAADPSWGRRIEPFAAFLEQKGFSGVALLPLPPQHLASVGGQRQQLALQAAEGRLALLTGGGRAGR